jgi:hypothetical protein
MSTGFSSAAIPNSPTIGSATATSDVAATVAYTAAVLGANGVTFTATSSPSSITGTGSSPITVTGLTASTSYTFSVTAGNANGTSAASSASNSITTSAPLSSYESIATVTVGSGGTSSYVEFTSIPDTFTHLQIRMLYGTSSAGSTSIMRLNADTSSGYAYHYVVGNGSTAFTGASINRNLGLLTDFNGGGVTSSPAVAILDLLDYASTSKYKTIRTLQGYDANGSGAVTLVSTQWRSTTAVTSFQIYPPSGGSFTQYSQFALYGIKGA